jgi:hypothetical protein
MTGRKEVRLRWSRRLQLGWYTQTVNTCRFWCTTAPAVLAPSLPAGCTSPPKFLPGVTSARLKRFCQSGTPGTRTRTPAPRAGMGDPCARLPLRVDLRARAPEPLATHSVGLHSLSDRLPCLDIQPKPPICHALSRTSHHYQLPPTRRFLDPLTDLTPSSPYETAAIQTQ